MNIIKRSLLFLKGKSKNSAILLLILTIICLSIISAFIVKESSSLVQKNINNENQNVIITNKKNVLLDDSHGAGELSKAEIEKIKTHKDIVSFNASQIGITTVNNLKLLKPIKNINYSSSDPIEDIYLSVFGNTNTKYDTRFIAGMMKLESGRHINKNDKNKILVHNKFAKLNNLKIGDKIPLSKDPIHYKGKDKTKIVAEIVGIFSGKTESNPTYPEEMIENTVLADESLVNKLYGYTQNNVKYYQTNFYLKKGADLDKFAKELKKLNLPWNKYEIIKKDPLLETYNRSIQVLTNTSNVTFYVIIVASMSILVLIMIYWVKMRQKETGILLSLGKSKLNIVGQYLFEILIISIVAICLACVSGEKIGNHFSANLVHKASVQAKNEVKKETGSYQMGADTFTDMNLQTVKNVKVNITKKDYIKFISILSLTISITTIGAMMFIVKLKPREILSSL